MSSLTGSPDGRSRFTYKQLTQLAQSATTCPLRVIAHVDLDAFYAQAEQVRLGLSPETPLAVQQWQGLIAINYPARAFGLTRFVTVFEARRLCPQLVTQHVATWREGDDHWAYHADAFKNMASHKVSLDPYRAESKKILACITDALPPHLRRVEKASVDEVFLDLSAQVHSIMLERYPELRGPPPYDDSTERLPAVATTALDWKTDKLVDLDATETEDDDPDWDDVAMLIGSEIVRSVRAAVHERLSYTCSAGVARNKMLSKLGSAYLKPNGQTVIRNRAAAAFLAGLKITKIRNLGGKLGDQVIAVFGTDAVADLLAHSAEKLRGGLGGEHGAWLYLTLRGEDTSEVVARTRIRSMLSAKSFRPPLTTIDSAARWLRVFVADIFGRLVEEAGISDTPALPASTSVTAPVAEDATYTAPSISTQTAQNTQTLATSPAANSSSGQATTAPAPPSRPPLLLPRRSGGLRPRTLTLHFRGVPNSGPTSRSTPIARSRQVGIPAGRPLDCATLLELARTLLAQTVADGRAWPCSNLSLSVGGFDDTSDAPGASGASGSGGIVGGSDGGGGGVGRGHHAHGMGIGGFLVRGEEAQALAASRAATERDAADGSTPRQLADAKRKRKRGEDEDRRGAGAAGGVGGIERFFGQRRSDTADGSDAENELEEDICDEHTISDGSGGGLGAVGLVATGGETHTPTSLAADDSPVPLLNPPSDPGETTQVTTTATESTPPSSQVPLCEKCGAPVPAECSLEHADWHLASELQDEERAAAATAAAAAAAGPAVARPGLTTTPAPPRPRPAGKSKGRSSDSRGGAGSGVQMKLAFGRTV